MEEESSYEDAADLVNKLMLSFLNLDLQQRSLFLKLLIIKLEDIEVDLVLQMGKIRVKKHGQDDLSELKNTSFNGEIEPVVIVKDEPNEFVLKSEYQYKSLSDTNEPPCEYFGNINEDSLECYLNQENVDLNHKYPSDQEGIEKIERFEKKNRQCFLCNYKCSGESELFRHVKHVHKENSQKGRNENSAFVNKKQKKVVCTFCNEVLTSQLKLIKHLEYAHKDEEEYKTYVDKLKVKKCNLCQKSFVAHSKLLRHMAAGHGEKKPKIGVVIKKFICSICLKSFSSKERVVFHIKQHDTNYFQKSDEELLNDYTLDMPDKFLKEEVEVRGLVAWRMDDKSSKVDMDVPVSKACPFCKEVFQNVRNNPGKHQYSSHVLSHKYENFTCDCNIELKTKRQKSQHVKLVHMGYSKCPQCHVCVRTKAALDKHMMTHDDPNENEILCDLCGEASPSKTQLINHMKKVHEKGLLTCKICGKKLISKSGLSTHKRTHLGPQQCPICGDFFKQLKVHMDQKHKDDSEKKYQCDMCNKGFLTMYEVNKHKMSAHIKSRPYNCRYGCTFAYNDKSNRNAHERKKHGGVAINGIATVSPVYKDNINIQTIQH